MNEPIIDYPEKMTSTPTYFKQCLLKTKIAWTSWVLLFCIFIFLAIFSTNDNYETETLPFILAFFILSVTVSTGGFIDGIKSLRNKEDVGMLRMVLIVANFSIFGLITIGIAYLIMLNLMN